MIANTFALAIAMSLSIGMYIDYTTTLIPVEINFCDFTSGEGESICTIQESGKYSRNKISFDQNGKNPKLLIDKRNVTSEKSKYIFKNDKITISKPNIINMPHINKSLHIAQGEYDVKLTSKGYVISLSKS